MDIKDFIEHKRIREALDQMVYHSAVLEISLRSEKATRIIQISMPCTSI